MDIRDAAGYFDQDSVYDGYTGALLFLGHSEPHDDHTSAGATSRRRTLVADPGTAAPARGVVQLYGERWLVGTSNLDAFQGQYLRRNFDLKKSTGLMAHLTPAEACRSSLGVEFYAHREYYRDSMNTSTESEWDTQWNIFCPQVEGVIKGHFLRQGSILYRVRNVYPTIELLDIAEADQFDTNALQVCAFDGEISLVTEAAMPGPTVPGIQGDIQKFYRYAAAAEAGQLPGDRAVFVPKSLITPTPGQQFTMSGARWTVVQRASELDTWALQVRLV